MDIVKTATDWTRAEMLSSAFFILFGLSFLLASLGFWQLGRTDMARAFVVPMLVAGTLILIIGVGLFLPSQARLTSFPAAYAIDSASFIAEEIARADRVMNEYRIAVFRVIPLIIAACALAILYFETPHWRASLVTTIAMMAVILVIDTNANARLEDYREQLALAGKSLPASI
jgi:predicted membrane channel-forming protein YqfA (hemolysin III family)